VNRVCPDCGDALEADEPAIAEIEFWTRK